MPWFKIDDSAYSHPRFVRAGNAALGLWMRCGSYSARYLTEGIVPGAIAQQYGTAPQIAKLVKVGLWHTAGHNCPHGCPQPEEGDYVFHDFFESGRNTTKAQHEANKQSAVDRAAKSRAGKKAAGFADDSSSKTDRFENETKTNRSRKDPVFLGSTAGQDDLSHRSTASGRADAHAAAMPYPGTSFGSTAAADGEREPSPLDTLGDLKRAISAAGVTGFSWKLQASQIERMRQVRERVGVDLMVSMAVNNVRLKGVPANASAWLVDWETIQPAAAGKPKLRSVDGKGHSPYQHKTNPAAHANGF